MRPKAPSRPRTWPGLVWTLIQRRWQWQSRLTKYANVCEFPRLWVNKEHCTKSPLRKYLGKLFHICQCCPTSIAVGSCLTGGGGHFGPHIYHTVYPDFILQLGLNISELEMLNALIAIKLWAPMLRNHAIRLQCDNSAAVSVLQTGRGRDSFLLSCAREVWAYTAQYKFEIRVEHIAGANNTLADQLSCYHSDLSCRARFDALIASTETILHPVDAHLFKLAECFQDVWNLVWITHFVTDIITLSFLYIALVFCSGSTLPLACCKVAHLLCIPPRYQGKSTIPD